MATGRPRVRVRVRVCASTVRPDRPTHPPRDRGPTARRSDPTDRPTPAPTDPPVARRDGPTDRPSRVTPVDDKYEINFAPPIPNVQKRARYGNTVKNVNEEMRAK